MKSPFLNADLDIFSSQPLDALIAEIGDRALLLHGGPFGEDLPYIAEKRMASSLPANDL